MSPLHGPCTAAKSHRNNDTRRPRTGGAIVSAALPVRGPRGPVNRSPASLYTDSHEFPRYNLEIAYQ